MGLIPNLGAVAGAGFIPLLSQLIENNHEAVSVRFQAILALASFKPEQADGTVWKSLHTVRQPQQKASLISAASWAWCELGRFEEFGLVKVPAGGFLMGSDKAKDEASIGREFPSIYTFTHFLYWKRTGNCG